MNITNIYGIILINIVLKEKRISMALNYKPLWIQLAKKGLKKTDVIAMAMALGLLPVRCVGSSRTSGIRFRRTKKIPQ